MNWLSENWDTIWMAFSSLVVAASLIVKLTPGDKDDKFVMKLMNFLAINPKKK